MWNNFFQTNPYGAVPLVLYHLFQLVVDTLLVPKFEQRNAGADEAESSRHTVPIGCHGDGE